jgi:hypothetical protein
MFRIKEVNDQDKQQDNIFQKSDAQSRLAVRNDYGNSQLITFCKSILALRARVLPVLVFCWK